jgi:hypothetical protein
LEEYSDNGNETSGSIKDVEFTDHMSDYQLLKTLLHGDKKDPSQKTVPSFGNLPKRRKK